MMKRPPKILESLSFFFPLIHLGSSLYLLTTGHLLVAVIWLYFMPPLASRIVQFFYPIKFGATLIGKKMPTGNSWLIANNLQKSFDSLPILEGILKTIPGAYSFWLRCWGAKIGRSVLWTAECRLVDRPLITIGDRTLIGNMSYLAAHAIKKKDGKYLLYCKPVHVGNDVVIAYRATLSPGCHVHDRALIEAGASLYPDQILLADQTYTRAQELKYVME